MKKSNYYSVVLLTIILSVFALSTNALEGNKGWSAKYENQKVFIENKGQFLSNKPNEKILYAYDNGSTMISFTSKGVTYSFLKRWKKEENKNEREREREGLKSGKSHAEMEAEEHKMEFKTDFVSFVWENANPNVEIVPSEETFDYHSYTFKDKDGIEKNINHINAFKKIIYKNIYPNIDIEYVFHPTDGIKYSLILHPGADISKVKMKYDDKVKLKGNGDLHIPTLFGDIVEHAPVTFYSENKSKIISSHFVKTDKTISFKIAEYDHTKTIIIDPWVQTPTMSSSNCVWECEKDGAGNVYIIGGDSPMQLKKYNATGVLQWTYNTPYDTAGGEDLGTFATDLAGNSYVTLGGPAQICKVNTSGTQLWNNAGGSAIKEYWNITFNCDQTKLIIGGMASSGLFPPLSGAIFDINTTNGSTTSTQIIAGSGIGTSNQEVRSITSSRNAKYYFLTFDTVGFINQEFSACASSPPIVKINSGYTLSYTCEDYRFQGFSAGIMAIRANKNFVYTQNGTTIQKRSLFNLAVIGSAPIPGGINTSSFGRNIVGNSGIDIDSCGNVYVGSGNGVVKYDANLNLITSVTTPFRVFDVSVSYGGNVIVCGATGNSSSSVRTGYVQSINMTSCDPMVLFCCNAAVCPTGNFCITAAPITLTPITSGGTWSGAGVNATTGVFSPSVAGPGTHTIIYTLSCGSDSTIIIVSACVPLTACQETNGNITATSGTAPYTWYEETITQDCSACAPPPFPPCTPPGCEVDVTSWASFTTGTTITPPGTYPIKLIDAAGDSLVITSLPSLPNCSNTCPTLTVTPSNIVHNNCFGQSTGSFDASTSGGVSPWDYTLVNGGGTAVATFTNVAGTQSFTGLTAGTYTLNVVDNNNCPGTTTIIITQPPAATTTATAGPDQSVCSNSATLAGNAPVVGTGVWTLVSGTGTITSPSSETSGITGLGVGATIFAWTISNPPCPSSSDQVTITNTGGGSPAAGPDQSICSSSAILAGNLPAFGTGVWTLISGTGTITTPSSATSGITGLGIGVAVFEWTISNPPCPATFDQITITNTGGGPTVTITSLTNVSCYGGSNGSTAASASGGTGSLTYLWTPSGGAAASANNLMAGTYTISVTDGNGCAGIETVSIIQPDLIVAIVSTTPTSCGSIDGSATVVASGGTGGLTYLWNNGGATTTTISNIDAGFYNVTITDSLGCTQTGSGTVAAAGGPTASVSADVTISSGSSILLSASGGGSYFWTPPAGLNCDTCRTPTASPVVTTIYCVMISDNSGCSDTACVTVTVMDTVAFAPCGTVYVPNAFTPNNNDLLNDTFKPVSSCVYAYSFFVFNRWGQKLFETTNPAEGWNGYFKGTLCKQDIYVYKIFFMDDPKKEFHQEIGKFLLLR